MKKGQAQMLREVLGRGKLDGWRRFGELCRRVNGIFLIENFTLVTRGNATFAQIAQRPTHGECDCGCAAPFRGLVLDYKYTTGLNTLQDYIQCMEGERGGVRKKSISM